MKGIIFQFFHLFGLFEAISAHNAWNYNKNFHQDWGKNSLDVIGHTHTSGLCLSPIRHSGGVCGPSCGASQSVCTHKSCFFHHGRNVLQHGKSYLSHKSFNTHTGLPGPHLFTLQRRADTWGNQKVGFHSEVTGLYNMSSCQGGGRGGECSRSPKPNISTFYLLDEARHNVYEEHFMNAL